MRVYYLLITLLLSGCVQQLAVKSIGGIMDDGFLVLNEEQDLQLAKTSIESNLKLLESIMRSDPENDHLLLLASMGYSSYALGFVEDDSLPRAGTLYLRGKEYGMKILRTNKRFSEAIDKTPEDLVAALNTFSVKDIPALFWTAIGWGSYISANLTDPAALVEMPKVEAIMQHVVRVDPTYYYGGAHFFLGTLLASRPVIFGGKPELAREHFEKCISISQGKFLMPYVYYAGRYAVQTQNRELFESLLATVENAPLDILPEARLSNTLAKQKARNLLQKADELF